MKIAQILIGFIICYPFMEIQAQKGTIVNIEEGGYITDCAVTPGGSVIIYPKGNDIIAYDINKMSELRQFKDVSQSIILSLAISEDSIFLVSGNTEGTLIIQNLRNGTIQNIHNHHKSQVLDIDISSDSRYCCSGDSEGKLVLTELTGKEVRAIDLEEYCEITSLLFTRNGKNIIGGTSSGKIFIYNISQDEIEIFPEAHEDWVRTLCLENNGERLYSGGDDKKLLHWDISSTNNIKYIHSKDKCSSWITACTVAADNSAFATGTVAGDVILTGNYGISYKHYLESPVRNLKILTDKTKMATVVATTYGKGIWIIPLIAMQKNNDK